MKPDVFTLLVVLVSLNDLTAQSQTRAVHKRQAGNSLSAVIWLPEKTPKLLFQITHGMTEHMGRYERLAEKLTEQGIVTAGFDLPGHGRNPGRPDCASFGEIGWTQTLADMQAFSEQLTSRFAGVPLILMGFSLGSFLVRDYLSSGYTLPSACLLYTSHLRVYPL